jgi:hypothetical protein
MALTLKTKLSGLNVGDYVWCKYNAPTSGQVGSFSNIATKTDADVSTQLIPVASSATPNGYFKLIKVGIDYLDRDILIADRNVQHSISWDVLNTNGISSGSGLPIKIDNNNESQIKFAMRLLTGGTVSTDKDNEWDNYIVNSTLGGAITAGDNAVWNWLNIESWSSTSVSAANRASRGYAASSSLVSVATATVNAQRGFRPVFIIETRTPYAFIKVGTDYKKYTNSWLTVSTTLPSIDTFINEGIEDLTIFDRKSTVFSQTMIDNGALGVGKTFKSTVDLDKYFDMISLNVR